MLISKVPDNEGGHGEGPGVPEDDDHTHEYQTANELFELMAKNQKFDTTSVETLTTRDLVLLYKNIDLGTKLMSNANELKRRRPNQYVENVVYNEEQESDGSDVSDIYSNEDLHNVFLINKERIDLLNTPPSIENTLCHKFGDLDIQTSNVTTDYDKHFLFKDPYIKEQLRTLKLSAETEQAMLPASLLDYICCKRLEDNYNFYMDNIIRYVKHTIEQLKRISNGDYLTEKAKEKWREVESVTDDPRNNNTKVLATSTSIPLHVERKIGGRKSTWDDIVHSAVDIRSLSKILEKKIVVEVPKLVCGSYKLLSKRCADNLIISCKKDKRPIEDAEGESRVDVVFQLQRSETGQVMSNISSIMILQTTPAIPCDTSIPSPLPLPFKELTNNNEKTQKNVEIIELEHDESDEHSESEDKTSQGIFKEVLPAADPVLDKSYENTLDNFDYGTCSDNDGTESLKNSSCQDSSESSDALRSILEKKIIYTQKEAVCDVVYPDDLRLTIQKLTIQTALPEESGEDMSQTTGLKKNPITRIKSPYENQSHVIEEKKRRKLLEIRERRERKKLALVENCRITKHKYGKGAIMPQSASSVTKLSISNKSFYNSIYGQSAHSDSKQGKGKNRKGGKRDVQDGSVDEFSGDNEAPVLTPEKNKQKYINRSYYLDDAVTEMMFMNMKGNECDGKELCSTSTSVISNDFRNNLNLLSQLIGPSDTELNVADDETSVDDKRQTLCILKKDVINNDSETKVLGTSRSILNIVPSNSPNIEEKNKNDPKKVISSVECRKSIDKIYDLMKKIENSQEAESKSSKCKYPGNSAKNNENNVGRESETTCQGSDSGTSLKHHLTSSNPSWFSFEKSNPESLKHTNYVQNTESPPNVVPKVIISSKSSSMTPKNVSDKNNKKDRRKLVSSPTVKVPENPLRAISQLLHEFENVQKTRQKPASEQKSSKKAEAVSSDGNKSSSRQNSVKRRSRLDQHNDGQTERFVKLTSPKEKKRSHVSMDTSKIPYQQIPVDEKYADKPKKKITDLLDEAKEARGEAVRGPSKLNSRLNSLAQPKRSYVQAHSEEFQNKYGKNVMADRLQRLAAAPPPPLPDRNTGSASSRHKTKRSGTEAMSTVSVKLPASSVPPLERDRVRTHFSSSSPEVKERHNQGVGPSYKQIIVPETPETLKKKMVAVESYVKNHYGRATSAAVVTEPQSVHKSRVPLVPHDIELVSSSSSPTAEESTLLGCRLHNIINTILTTNSQGLEVLTECHESNSKLSKENMDEFSLAEDSSRSDHVSTDSEYAIDVLDDNNIPTTVENIEKARKEKNLYAANADIYNLPRITSNTELERLENALCRRISVGTFPKRLRIKNLTLTPKQSMQQVIVLQSGDAGSLVVKTPNYNDTKTDKYPDLSTLPVISKSHVDWRFTNFPMQISTVGYAFPDYKSIQCESGSRIQLFKDDSKTTGKISRHADSEPDKNDERFKACICQSGIEKAAQVAVPVSTLVSIGIGNTNIVEIKNEKVLKQSNATNTDTSVSFTEFNQKKADKESFNDGHTQTKVIEAMQTTVIEATQTKFIEETESKVIGEVQTKVFEQTLDSIVEIKRPIDLEYTTSLDMLVGLLSEIQKITTCQTQITNSDRNEFEDHDNKELETILNKAATIDASFKSSPREIVSLTSLEKLRQLESNPSLYSFYLSDTETTDREGSQMHYTSEILPLNTTLLFPNPKPICADKEVGVDFLEREYVNRFTDVPSQIFPISINHSTNVTNSLIGVISQPSTQSVFSFSEYHSTVFSNTSLCNNNNIQIPQIIITKESSTLSFHEIIEPEEKPLENNTLVKKEFQSSTKDRVKKTVKLPNTRYRLKSEFDPIIKMKRDILVTFYSILVFTVFAALTFPSEMLYHV